MRILISNFLGGETSDIFYVHPDPWEMIQFDECAYHIKAGSYRSSDLCQPGFRRSVVDGGC